MVDGIQHQERSSNGPSMMESARAVEPHDVADVKNTRQRSGRAANRSGSSRSSCRAHTEYINGPPLCLQWGTMVCGRLPDPLTACEQLTTVDVGVCWLRRLCRNKAVRHTGCALITVAYVACNI